VVGGVLVGHEADGPALTSAVRGAVDVSERLVELRRDPACWRSSSGQRAPATGEPAR
jgi:hypothetical protein